MTTLAWTALAAALLLLPGPAPAPERIAVLVRAGRLVAPAARAERPRVHGPAPPLVAGGCVAAVGAVGAVGVVRGPALGIAVGVLLLAGAAVLHSGARRRRRARHRRDLLAAVSLLVAELEAGSRPAEALAAAAATAPAHRSVFLGAARTAAEGGDVARELLTADNGELAGVGHAWRVAEGSGSPSADVLSRLAADLAAEQAQERAVATALSGARATAALLAGLPMVGVLLGAAMGARPVAFLVDSSAGRLVCCAGAILDAAGVLWTQQLMRHAEAG